MNVTQMFKDGVLSALIPRVWCLMESLCCPRVKDADVAHVVFPSFLCADRFFPFGCLQDKSEASLVFSLLSVSFCPDVSFI